MYTYRKKEVVQTKPLDSITNYIFILGFKVYLGIHIRIFISAEESTGNENSLIILVLDEFNDNILLWLYLEHLHDEAHERRGLPIATVGTSKVVELHRLVHESLGRQAKALFLPIRVLIYLRSQNLLN